jgi:uncharacterized protein YktB (UPF0637 family)
MGAKKLAGSNDQRLMEIAAYHESRGMIRAIESPEKLWGRFAEFKQLVRRGSFTINQLEDRIYSNFGIMSGLTKAEELQKILEETRKMTNEFKKRDMDHVKENKEKGVDGISGDLSTGSEADGPSF